MGLGLAEKCVLGVNSPSQFIPSLSTNTTCLRRYVTADASKNQKMFYVFGEAETSPKDAPVIFWMNG